MNAGVAIVTGTRKGLGRFLAMQLLAKGWRVAGCSREPAGWEHPAYRHFEVDVSDERAVVRMVRSVARAEGKIDAVINNAGTASMNHLLLSPAASVRTLFETNFTGTFLFLREAAKVMARHDGGRIVNLSSVAVALDLQGEGLYAASKSAVESLTRIAARELAAQRITVNAVAPTPVDTDLIRTVPPEKITALLQHQAIRRLGTPEDVWNVVEFFLRPESSFITGQIIYLGGVRG
jgi:3-oxoacyl-[acyl-carrier protein] reductase